MQHAYKINITKQLKERTRSFIRHPQQVFTNKKKRICPCCHYQGPFISMRSNLPESRCPNCASRPRDRLLALALTEHKQDLEQSHVLHFSPEPNLFNRLINNPLYISGDIKPSKYARYQVDITKIPYDDASFDVIICNHVLEHVHDHIQALTECYRVLKPGGIAFFSVPYQHDQQNTWYPPAHMTTQEIEKICGWDHKRLYGQDFPQIISSVGFSTTKYVITNDTNDTYRVLENDPIFIAYK